MLFCHITTKISGRKNDGMLREKGGTGFPYIIFLDNEGDLIAKLGSRSLDGFKKTGKKASEFLALKKKADDGDEQAKISYTIAKMGLNPKKLTLEEAKKEIEALGKLDKEQQAAADALLATVETMDIMKSVTRDAQTRIDAGKKFAAMEKDGRIPDNEDAFQPFYILMLDYAEAEKDVKLFEKALKALRDKYGDMQSAKRFFDKQDGRLKKLKEDE